MLIQVEAMQYDIEEGNFSATLLEKLEEDGMKTDNSYSLIS
jgi:hypothetical protein